MYSYKRIATILTLGIVLFLVGLFLQHRLYPQGKHHKAEVSAKQATQNILGQLEKPLAVKEWELVWGDLWNNEAAELKRKGISDAKIVAQLNPLAAERVAKRLNLDEGKVRQIVDGYYLALNKLKAK